VVELKAFPRMVSSFDNGDAPVEGFSDCFVAVVGASPRVALAVDAGVIKAAVKVPLFNE